MSLALEVAAGIALADVIMIAIGIGYALRQYKRRQKRKLLKKLTEDGLQENVLEITDVECIQDTPFYTFKFQEVHMSDLHHNALAEDSVEAAAVEKNLSQATRSDKSNSGENPKPLRRITRSSKRAQKQTSDLRDHENNRTELSIARSQPIEAISSENYEFESCNWSDLVTSEPQMV